MLAGCVGGPTYGTDKTSAQQFFDDLSNIATIGNINKTAKLDTKPRPELVPPSSIAVVSALPVPQENVARINAPDWPEAPEKQRERLRNEATLNQSNPNYISPIIKKAAPAEPYLPDGLNHARERESWTPTPKVIQAQRQEFLRRKRTSEGGSTMLRRYLSEPPLDYRMPATTAPIGEIGDDEAKKERERQKAARGKSGWWPF